MNAIAMTYGSNAQRAVSLPLVKQNNNIFNTTTSTVH